MFRLSNAAHALLTFSCVVLPLACLWFVRKLGIPIEDRGSIVVYRLKSPIHGMEILVGSAHLDFNCYSVYLPRGYQASSPFGKLSGPNTNLGAIDATERASMRLPALHAFVDYINGEDELKRLPSILCGDFNDASHLDWTEATKSLQDHHGVVYEFPSSKFMEHAGFRDAWREAYPDPVKYPGTTWPSDMAVKESTSWAKLADERDRIDYIYYKSGFAQGLAASHVTLAGSRNFYVDDKLVTDTSDDPFVLGDKDWPSDHKAVIADFQLSHTAV